jgi:hypothetical protein
LALPERDFELEYDCPRLISEGYTIKSPVDPSYNCVAFALGDTKNFWYDAKVRGYYWPPGCGSADTMDGWISVFQLHGYEDCDSDLPESDFEKIAIFGGQSPGHVARQKASGIWVSKMGKGCDIEHTSLSALECELMGGVLKIMKRKCRDGRRVLE